MSKSTHRENELLRKMQERIDAKAAELQRLARQQKEELDFSASKHELERLSQWEPMPSLVPPGTIVTISSSSTEPGLTAGAWVRTSKWRADFQHVLDALEYLGHVEKITPVDGMPEHVVIELADGGGWLYYGPDQGLRTLTAKQARHYLSCEAERHVEEGVWA